jgi:dolichol-phosphate mannosyltransferase
MQRSMYRSINAVIPVYNEGENIVGLLKEMQRKVKTPCRIYIVYDFEEDNTPAAVKAYMQDNANIYLVKNRFGRGPANAIKTGFEAVDDGIVLVLMADRSDDLVRVDEMFKKVNEGYDVVCGSRYMKGGKQTGGPRLKKLLSRIAGISLHYLIGVPTHDITNSFKMYTKKVIDDMTIESKDGFELGMEIVLKAFINGYKITEVPCVWRCRSVGRSRFRLWKWLPKYLKWYVYGIKTKPKTGAFF